MCYRAAREIENAHALQVLAAAAEYHLAAVYLLVIHLRLATVIAFVHTVFACIEIVGHYCHLPVLTAQHAVMHVAVGEQRIHVEMLVDEEGVAADKPQAGIVMAYLEIVEAAAAFLGELQKQSAFLFHRLYVTIVVVTLIVPFHTGLNLCGHFYMPSGKQNDAEQ